jgi:hypothetical protein
MTVRFSMRKLLQKAETEVTYLTAAVRRAPVKAAICQMEAARTVPERTIQTEAETHPMTKTIMMTAAKKNITNAF